MSSDGIEERRGIRLWRMLVAVALVWMAGAAVSPLPGATHDLGTLPANLVQRFGIPVIREVIGGENGGRVLALAADLDDGASEGPHTAWWTHRPGRPRWSFFRSGMGLAVERASPETIYSLDYDGVLRRSTDGGETWKRRGEPPVTCHTQLLVAERPGLLYLAGDDVFSSCDLLRSKDGGRTWDDLGDVGASTLVFSPADPDLVIGYGRFMIVRSRDAGDSFVDITPPGASGAREVAPARSDAAILYAVPNDEELAPFLWRSHDGGATWKALAPPAADVVGLSLAVDPRRPSHVVALAAPRGEPRSNPRSFESFDGGDHWHARAVVPASRLRFVADGRKGRVEAFGRRGLHESRDGGATWHLADHGIAADHDLLLAGASGDEMFVAQRLEGDVWRSTDGGRGWEHVSRLPGGVGQILVSPLASDHLAAIAGGRLWWSDNAGAGWSEVPQPRDADHTSFVYSLSFHPLLADVLYAASSWDAWRTADRGRTWERVTGAIPDGEECSSSTGNCRTVRDVEQIFADALVPNRLYALVHGYSWMRSDDSGGTWTSVASPALAASQPATLVLDPRVRDRLYWGVQTGTEVFVSDRAGDLPWRRLLSSYAIGPFHDTWMTLDGAGNLLIQPEWYVNVFFRRRERGGWDRFALRLPGDDVTRVVAGRTLPGGGSVLFVVLRGLGLWRVELPGSEEHHGSFSGSGELASPADVRILPGV